MKLEKCPCCGDEPIVSGDCDNGYEALSICGLSMWQPTMDKLKAAWDRRYACLDKNGKPIFAGDGVKYNPSAWRKQFVLCKVVAHRPPRYGYGLVPLDTESDFWTDTVYSSDIELIESEVKE